MAKEIHKRISVWLNQQGIENNLKSVRTAINKTANELAKLPIVLIHSFFHNLKTQF